MLNQCSTILKNQALHNYTVADCASKIGCKMHSPKQIYAHNTKVCIKAFCHLILLSYPESLCTKNNKRTTGVLEVSSETDSPLSKLIGANSQNRTSCEMIYLPTVALQNTALLQSARPQLSVQGWSREVSAYITKCYSREGWNQHNVRKSAQCWKQKNTIFLFAFRLHEYAAGGCVLILKGERVILTVCQVLQWMLKGIQKGADF